MKKKLFTILCLLLLLVTITGCKRKKKEEPKPEPKPPVIVTNENFTYSFLNMETNRNNLIYSPLSIKYALYMLREGANGQTKEEIEKLLKDSTLTTYENYEKNLSLANALFIRDTYKNYVLDSYKTKLETDYKAEVIYDAFKKANIINDWISKKTLDIIQNMLKDEQVTDSNVILVNALAIDMEWQEKFEREDTSKSEFHVSDKETIDVAMMHSSSSSLNNKYYKDEKLTMVSKPLKKYGDTQLEFVAIMPLQIEKYLSDDRIDEDLAKLQSINEKEKLSISIPKFKFDYNLKLKDDLKQLGIETVFTEDADLTNLSSTGTLYVTDALHKADIEFSEDGIKAAAATAVVGGLGGTVTVFTMKDNAVMIEDKRIELTFDRPFIFLIRDVNTGEKWFVGTVYEPTLWKTVESEY